MEKNAFDLVGEQAESVFRLYGQIIFRAAYGEKEDLSIHSVLFVRDSEGNCRTGFI